MKRSDRKHRPYDVVGDVAIIHVPKSVALEASLIAEAIMKTDRHVKAVLKQSSAVEGDFRLRGLEWILGEKKTKTVHKESGCFFSVDLAECYFSPRLSFERLRIAHLMRPGEVAVNMFAGVGCFSILMVKFGGARKVYSIDANPAAVDFLRENVKLNRMTGRVVPILDDSKDVVLKSLQGVADRVIMPLPDKAFEYLDFAILALKPGLNWVHYYDFVHAVKTENPVEKVRMKVAKKLKSLGLSFSVPYGRVVRSTGPHWYQIVLDICVDKRSIMQGHSGSSNPA
jgi:tRNA (guanine37-N1)-methyltransferase